MSSEAVIIYDRLLALDLCPASDPEGRAQKQWKTVPFVTIETRSGEYIQMTVRKIYPHNE